jgi:hypothetical protein
VYHKTPLIYKFSTRSRSRLWITEVNPKWMRKRTNEQRVTEATVQGKDYYNNTSVDCNGMPKLHTEE